MRTVSLSASISEERSTAVTEEYGDRSSVLPKGMASTVLDDLDAMLSGSQSVLAQE